MLDTIAKGWRFVRDVVTVVRPCRFSLLVVAGGGALLLSDQGQELTTGLPSDGLGKVFWFHFCVFLWAFQSWYWARSVLDLTFGLKRGADLENSPIEPKRLEKIITRAPRWIAVGAYAVALAACALALPAAGPILVSLLVHAVLFYLFLMRRTDLTKKLAGESPGLRHSFFSWREGDGVWSRLPLLSISILCATVVCAIGLTVWACTNAVGFGWTFGAAAVPFLGFSMIVPVGSALVLAAHPEGRARFAGRRRFPDTRGDYPVILLLLGLALFWSCFPVFDNHELRTLPGASAKKAPALDESLKQWHGQAPKLSDGRSNMIVVATAGGGLRAAYWTATVLGALQDRSRAFDRQLLAISGVSGGSLGAAVFVTLASGQVSLSDWRGHCGDGELGAGPLECAGQAVLSQDFLAPTVAALLFPDLLQRFIPVHFPDRAKALEQSWERAWSRAGFEDPWAERGFRTLWPGDRVVPALLLNSTHVETGKRIIASNLAIEPKVFRDAFDLYGLIEPDSEIRTSTAAHTSARFTYVSPAGTLRDKSHLVDGGYFENFGAVTARELLEAGFERLGGKKAIRPIAILISNDIGLAEGDFPAREPKPLENRKHSTRASEVLSPLRAVLEAREAHGMLAASELRAFVEGKDLAGNGRDGRYFQFRLCKEEGRPSPALGWVLSPEAEHEMRRQLRSSCGNAEQMKALLDALEGR